MQTNEQLHPDPLALATCSAERKPPPMTARSKVTLTEAQEIRTRLIKVVMPGDSSFNEHQLVLATIDMLMLAGLIDTDAALKLLGADQ